MAQAQQLAHWLLGKNEKPYSRDHLHSPPQAPAAALALFPDPPPPPAAPCSRLPPPQLSAPAAPRRSPRRHHRTRLPPVDYRRSCRHPQLPSGVGRSSSPPPSTATSPDSRRYVQHQQ